MRPSSRRPAVVWAKLAVLSPSQMIPYSNILVPVPVILYRTMIVNSRFYHL